MHAESKLVIVEVRLSNIVSWCWWPRLSKFPMPQLP